MNPRQATRREVLIGAGLGVAGLALPLRAATKGRRGYSRSGVLRFGVIADVHQDVMHDGERRLGMFLDAMNEADPGFILQLGDFCVPHERNDPFMELWNTYPGAAHHVIGNHETDGGYTRDRVVEYFGMPSRYYSFDQSGVHVVVLDGNDPGGTSGGYARFVAADQAEWLRNDLASTSLPTVVFIHQPLDSDDGVDNRAEIRSVLEESNQSDGHAEVLAVFSGHSHVDYCRQINGIYYVLINSASYQWVGSDYKHQSYGPQVHKAAPSLDRTCPFREPLWAVVTLDLEHRVMQIEGRETEWVGPSPVECGADFVNGYWGWDPKYCQPRVSGWRVPVASRDELG